MAQSARFRPGDLTSGVLEAFYSSTRRLSSLLPPSTLRDSDSDAFKAFLDAIIVGSSSEMVLGPYCEDAEASMKEVSSRRLESLRTACVDRRRGS